MYANAVVATGNGSGTLFTGNDLNTAGANSMRLVGLYAQGVDGVTISNNNIANMSNSLAESPRAIWLATGTNHQHQLESNQYRTREDIAGSIMG